MTLEGLNRRVDELEAKMQRPITGAPEKHWLDSVVSDGWKTYQQVNYKGAFIAEVRPPQLEAKAIMTSSFTAMPATFMPGIAAPPSPRVRIRSLLPAVEVATGSVEWAVEDTFSNSASPVSEGSTKPESDVTFRIVTASLRTLAHWITCSLQVLEDFGALKSYLDAALIEKLLDIEDYELLHGSGVGQHLHGICTQATAYSGGGTGLDAIAGAMGELEGASYAPSAVVLHPSDWRTITASKSTTGEYIFGPPISSAQARLWDVQVVRTPAMPQGRFLVGDFRHAVLLMRLPALLEVSSEHDTYFIKNLVAIRAEERITIAVLRPAAFRYGSLT